MRLGVDIFSTGQVAKLCGCSPKRVSAVMDSGQLRAYRVLGGADRRVLREDLVRFLERQGMAYAVASLRRARTVLLAGLPAGLSQAVSELLLAPQGANGTARPPAAEAVAVAADLFELGWHLRDEPAAAVVDLALGGRDEFRRALERCVAVCKRVVVLMPEDFPPCASVAFTGEGGWERARLLQHPCAAGQIIELLGEGEP